MCGAEIKKGWKEEGGRWGGIKIKVKGVANLETN